LPRRHRCTQGCDCYSFQNGQIESIFSEALGRFEMYMGKYGFFAVEGDNLESDTLPALADFLGVKTAGRPTQLVDDALYQRRLPAAGTTSEQKFSDHLTTFGSGSARKTKQCVRRSWLISIRARTVGTCRLCRDAAAAMIWAYDPYQLWLRSPFSKCRAW